MSTGAQCSLYIKKHHRAVISTLQKMRVGAASLNGWQAKTEHYRQLTGAVTGIRGTNLLVIVAGSRVTAFLTTAAPQGPYFMDNPRIMQRTFLLLKKSRPEKEICLICYCLTKELIQIILS